MTSAKQSFSHRHYSDTDLYRLRKIHLWINHNTYWLLCTLCMWLYMMVKVGHPLYSNSTLYRPVQACRAKCCFADGGAWYTGHLALCEAWFGCTCTPFHVLSTKCASYLVILSGKRQFQGVNLLLTGFHHITRKFCSPPTSPWTFSADSIISQASFPFDCIVFSQCICIHGSHDLYLCICSSFSFVALPLVSPLHLQRPFMAVHALNAYMCPIPSVSASTHWYSSIYFIFKRRHEDECVCHKWTSKVSADTSRQLPSSSRWIKLPKGLVCIFTSPVIK